ncbi:16465_t:CDS:2, partial [Cetraspora pellucida]
MVTSDFKLQETLLSNYHMPHLHTGQDILKGVELLKENYLPNINWQSCVAHTFQLTVKEDLLDIIQSDAEDEIVNPLEVLTDYTEAQICTELSLLESQLTNSNNNEEIEKNLVNINEDPQDSLSAELWGLFSISDQTTAEDEFMQYIKEQIAYKNQNPLT